MALIRDAEADLWTGGGQLCLWAWSIKYVPLRPSIITENITEAET